ncbi:MAG: ribonuclease Z [Candidatus Staskawiczbacteria bacterium]|nr:ribonuclease Z [Candidatus Staskawiczbacteria bacterium]
MKIIFLGVGDAFDETLPTNSSLVISKKTSLMLDCGDSAVRQLWKIRKGNDSIDALYVTHHHPDHLFGISSMLDRMLLYEKRTKPLTIICSKTVHKNIIELRECIFKSTSNQDGFRVDFIDIESGQTVKFQDLELSFSSTVHSAENIAVKVSDGESAMAYSGDGSPVSGSDFYKDLDLLILETYLYDIEKIGHSSIVSGIKFAEGNNAKCLALTHISRDFRKNDLARVKDKIKSDKFKIIIPEPMDEMDL